MQPIVLDISRTVSRVSRGPATGIDRVEIAYIEHFLEWPGPVFFLARFGKRNVLLDCEGMRQFYTHLLNNGPWDALGILSKLRKKKRHESARVEATGRRFSLSWPFLSSALRRHVPDGFTYLNVGHGAMRADFWPKLKRSNVGRIGILIHDVIPLYHPEYSSESVRERYPQEFQAAVTAADFLIYNSEDTKDKTEFWLKKWGADDVESLVVLLGTNPLPYVTETEASGHPNFVILGTIEPRKNHRLLLDIWEYFHKNLPEEEIPHLYIVGRRGWLNEEIFHRLDTAEYMDKTVHEMNEIPDPELGQLLANTNALLFPSLAEGFGYPLVEAIQMNTPVICSNLSIFDEIAGDYPTYINSDDSPAWRKQILGVSTLGRKPSKTSRIMPSWAEHFLKIETILGNSS